MLKATFLTCGVAGLVIAAGLTGAIAQGASGGSGGSASGGSTGLSGGQTQGGGGRSDQTGKAADGSTSKGVAGTGMGTTTPAMQSDTSPTGGNGLSVQRPDPGAAKDGQAAGGGSGTAKP